MTISTIHTVSFIKRIVIRIYPNDEILIANTFVKNMRKKIILLNMKEIHVSCINNHDLALLSLYTYSWKLIIQCDPKNLVSHNNNLIAYVSELFIVRASDILNFLDKSVNVFQNNQTNKQTKKQKTTNSVFLQRRESFV